MTRIDDDLTPSPVNPASITTNDVPDADEPTPISLRPNAVDQVRREIRTGSATKVLDTPTDDIQGAASEADDYPNAPAEGFANRDQLMEFLMKMNAEARKKYAEFKSHPDKYRLHDPENPDKFIETAIHTCADGRCNPALFAKNPLEHFNLNWLPAAGLKLFPEIPVPHSTEELELGLGDSKALREKIFERFDMLYGPSMEKFLREQKAGVSSRFFIEFQAHFDSHHYPDHGCGAHGSKLADAQKESIKNSALATTWLKTVYPEQYAKGSFRVFRTIQDTSKKGNVYEGAFIDKMVSPAEQGDFTALFREAQRKFLPPEYTDKEKGIARTYCGNPFGIDTDEHNEQGVRVSNLQYASTLNGQSAMEICWNDPDILLADNKLLLFNIISTNKFSTNNPTKPHYIHLDLVKGDPRIQAVNKKLLASIRSDSALKARLDDNSLLLALTETDPATMKMEQLVM